MIKTHTALPEQNRWASWLQTIICAHLGIVLLQVIIRSTIIDVTFVRDIGLMASMACYAVYHTSRMRGGDVPATIIVAWLYIAYGAVRCSLAASSGAVAWEICAANFRNHFLPVVLVPISFDAFSSIGGWVKLLKVTWMMFVVIVILTLAETALYYTGRWDLLPWYAFAFRTSYRFFGNSVGAPGEMHTTDTPLLGMFGWSHDSAAVLTALFALAAPITFGYGFSHELRRALGASYSFRWLIAVGAVVGIAAFLVKMQYAALVAVLSVGAVLYGRRWIFTAAVVSAALAAVMSSLSGFAATAHYKILSGFVGTANSSSTLEIIIRESGLRTLSNYSWDLLLFGKGDPGLALSSGGDEFEVRLLLFTAAFGATWLFLAGLLILLSLLAAARVVREPRHGIVAKVITAGFALMGLVYVLDVLHYARIMYAPNIDIACVVLGVCVRMACQPVRLYRNTTPRL